jgi:tRNA(Ile)-lysidine synthase
LLGIPQVNDTIVRPLLIFSRDEIENYAQENNIEWREDSSNESDKYFRNKIRHNIVPILKELNPNLLDSFQNTIHNLSQTKTLAQETIEKNFQETITQFNDKKLVIDIEKLLLLPNFESFLYEWLKEYGFQDWESIKELVTAQSGKYVLSEKHRLLKDRTTLILSQRKIETDEEFQIFEDTQYIESPIKLSFCKQAYISVSTKSAIFVDKEKLKFPLTLRKWQEGDYFYPSGMNGKKKVSKYFKDEKFSLIDKENTWLLCSSNDVIWIINHRADKRYIATTNTKNILNINLL